MAKIQPLRVVTLILACLPAGLYMEAPRPMAAQMPIIAPVVKPGEDAAKPQADAASKAAATAAVRAAYVIGPEDVLFIRVWEKPELSGAVNVGPDGGISMQLVGEITAAGFTPHQLEEELAKKLRKFYKELDTEQVNVQVTRVNSRTYILQGEVGRPGVYPITKPMKIMEALVAGGNFGPFANKKKIYLLRGTERHYFNWVEVSKGRHLEQNIEVQNGDQIFVP